MIFQMMNGLVYGGLLYIVAVGLVLIFGLRRVVNFAHGGLFMVGAYVGYTVAVVAGFWWGIVAAIVVLAVLGGMLDMTIFRKLQDRDPIATLLVTFGLLLILEDAAQSIWGKDFRAVPVPSILSGSIHIAEDSFPTYRLFVIILAGAVAIGLSAWLRLSRVGLFVRASSTDRVTTAMQGVNTDRLSMIVVAVGAALAGLSGIVSAPLLALSPSMGGEVLVDSFIVVVVGGLGSFSGAFIAALVIGQVHNFGLVYMPWGATMFPFVLMIAVLIWRPTGVAGSHT